MRISLTPRRSKTRGFTLTELAIVFGAMGAIIAAIWVAAGTVSDNNKAYLTAQQIGRVTQNIREYYMNAQGIPPAACSGADVTAALDTNGLFPAEMRSGTVGVINSAYATSATGSFRVKGPSCPGTSSRFWIVLTNLTPAACARLLFSGINYQDQSMGITAVCGASETSTTTPCYSGTAGTGTTGGWFNIKCLNGVCDTYTQTGTHVPLTLPQAQTLCSSASTSEVGWEFKLRD
ncbi:MAG: hypothetical protein P4M13_03420 [Alphaproteobacteria bacterium]|nr:hypothetical protein [Alphaproteobacteria bacterium]